MEREYTVQQLANLAGVSPRTLRYYDSIGLLVPGRSRENSYRIYTRAQVDLLQQILLYRELGMPLEEIGKIVLSPAFDAQGALESHRAALEKERERLDTLLHNVEKTLNAMKGECDMKDSEKFAGLKEQALRENEEKYGAEIRQKYGDDAVDATYARIKGMSDEQWQAAEALRGQIDEALAQALATGDPAGEAAKKLCEMHRDWICLYWKKGTYNKGAHLTLGEMYVADERFKAYYDRQGEGAAEFLRDALRVFCA